MKKAICLFSVMIILFLSCTKDKCTEVATVLEYTPVYESMSNLRNVQIQASKNIMANGKIFTKDNFIYLNEVNKGFHIIDNRNPAQPRNIAFVSVPGNIDIAAKGNFLLVDNYWDLLTFDISNPTSIQLVTRKQNALPIRQYNYGYTDDSIKGVIVGFTKKTVKVENACNMQNWWRRGELFFQSFASSNAAPNAMPKSFGGANGQAGSLSRFAVLNNHLYIANRFSISSINIADPIQPIVKDKISTGELETMYAFNNHLLIGSPTGMFIYGVTNPDKPNFISSFSHWRGCDPVVAQNNTAYVTVRGSGPCGGANNNLDVLDISNMAAPRLIKTYQMENPYGLGVFNNKLGICDGNAGFKLFDASNSNAIQLQKTLTTHKAFDVIMNDQLAILIAQDGMYQYNITNSSNPIFISKISIGN